MVPEGIRVKSRREGHTTHQQSEYRGHSSQSGSRGWSWGATGASWLGEERLPGRDTSLSAALGAGKSKMAGAGLLFVHMFGSW